MKIAMFTDAYWPRVNGVTVSVDTFSLALIKAGHEVMIVCSEYPVSSITEFGIGKKDPAREKLKLLRVPSHSIFFSSEDRMAKLSKRGWVENRLDAFSPELVHINTEFFIGNFGFCYAKKRRLPAVYTFHTIWEDYASNYLPYVPGGLLRFIIQKGQRHLLKQATLVIVPTPQIEAIVKSYRVKKEMRRLPTGIDPALFTHSEEELAEFRIGMEKKYPAVKEKKLLLFAGRVSKEKNISFIIELFPALLARHADLVLVIAGNGPYLDYFKNQAEHCGVGESCIFTGYLERAELALTYAVSHIFLMPSLTETQGLVTIEAMFSGIPVVAIGAMGTVQLMEGDQGGFMVRNDKEEFKARILQLLEDGDLYRRKSEEARRHAQKWTIGCLTGQLVEIYREASRFMGR
ncbi:MAG: glycosyltransferase [Spirochaetaceae bacterium]|jgi:glycosyltransferase involved in cell wall biosynthesis|nr:glycosyltransferase [Spirochaetaceae bacterium]